MNYIKLLNGFFEKVDTDDRLNPTHVSMYMAIFQFWNVNHFQNPISICRSQVMRVSKICSNATYHKCIKELNDYGYLEYIPSFNPYKGSLVNLFNLGTIDEDLLQENEGVLPENLLLFDPQNEPISSPKKEEDLTKIQLSKSVDNVVIHTENQTGSSNFNPTKNDTACVQALVPSINVINVIKENIYNKENEIFKIEIPKKNIPELEEKKEKSCAKKELQKVPSVALIIPTLKEVIEYFILKNIAPMEAEKFFNYYESNGWLVGGKTKMKNWNAASRNWMLNAKNYNQEKPSPHPSNLHTIKNKNYNEPL